MGKRIYELTLVELKRKSRTYNFVFWCYVLMALFISVITGFFSIQSLNNVMGIQDKDITFLVLLSCVLVSVNVLFIVFLWFVSESSYYKMLQLNADMMIYLKDKLGE